MWEGIGDLRGKANERLMGRKGKGEGGVSVCSGLGSVEEKSWLMGSDKQRLFCNLEMFIVQTRCLRVYSWVPCSHHYD